MKDWKGREGRRKEKGVGKVPRYNATTYVGVEIVNTIVSYHGIRTDSSKFGGKWCLIQG